MRAVAKSPETGLTDKHGKVREIEVTVYGWKVIGLIDAATKIPLAVQGVPIKEPEGLSLRALVTQARANLAGAARLHKVVFDRGFLRGRSVGLDQPGPLRGPSPRGHGGDLDARHWPAGDGLPPRAPGAHRPHGQGKAAGVNGGRQRWWALRG